MPLTRFPISPYAVLDPDIRWYPGDQQEMFTEDGYARLLPPLVHKIRKGTKACCPTRISANRPKAA